MSTFNKLFSPEIVKHMNINTAVSDQENTVSVLESVLKRTKIENAIAKNKESIFKIKEDKLRDILKLVLYNVEKQKSFDGSPDSIQTYVDFLEQKIKNLKQEIQQVESDIFTNERNTEKSVAVCSELLEKIEHYLA